MPDERDGFGAADFYPMRPQIVAGNNPYQHSHVHERYHEMLIVDAGRAHQLTVLGTLPCRVGEVFFFPAGVPHQSWCAEGEELWPLVMHVAADAFDGDDPAAIEARGLMQRLCELGRRDSRIAVSTACAQKLRRLLSESVAAAQDGRPLGHCLHRGLFLQMLAFLAAEPDLQALPRRQGLMLPGNRELIQRVLHLIECEYHRRIDIDEALALCPLSRSRFHEVFKAETGMTFSEAVSAQRLREACRLLRESDESMLDIALRCGFGSQSHFNHQFKRAYGCSPRAWKMRLATADTEGC